MMKTLHQILLLAGLGASLCLSAGSVQAQDERRGRGNFDPEEMRQRMMDRYREQLDVKDDSEWKLISSRIEKVNEARRATMAGGGMAGAMFGRGPGGPGGPPSGGDDGGRRRGEGGGRGGGGFRGMMSEPLPEATELQKAIDAKASNEEIKSKLAKLRDAKKSKEAELDKAQDELRKVLSVRQEAVAVMSGLLK